MTWPGDVAMLGALASAIGLVLVISPDQALKRHLWARFGRPGEVARAAGALMIPIGLLIFFLFRR